MTATNLKKTGLIGFVAMAVAIVSLSLSVGCDNKSRRRAKKAEKKLKIANQNSNAKKDKNGELETKIEKLKAKIAEAEVISKDLETANKAFEVSKKGAADELRLIQTKYNDLDKVLEEFRSKHGEIADAQAEVDKKLAALASEKAKMLTVKKEAEAAEEAARQAIEDYAPDLAKLLAKEKDIARDMAKLKKETDINKAALHEIQQLKITNDQNLALATKEFETAKALHAEAKLLVTQANDKILEYEGLIAKWTEIALTFSFSNPANEVFQAKIRQADNGKRELMPIYLDLVLTETVNNSDFATNFRTSTEDEKVILDLLLDKIKRVQTEGGLNYFSEYAENKYAESVWKTRNDTDKTQDIDKHHQFLIQAYPDEVADFFIIVNAKGGLFAIPEGNQEASLKNFRLEILLVDNVKVEASLSLLKKVVPINRKKLTDLEQRVPELKAKKLNGILRLIANLPLATAEITKKELFGDGNYFTFAKPHRIFKGDNNLFESDCPESVTANCFAKLKEKGALDQKMTGDLIKETEEEQQELLYRLHEIERSPLLTLDENQRMAAGIPETSANSKGQKDEVAKLTVIEETSEFSMAKAVNVLGNIFLPRGDRKRRSFAKSTKKKVSKKVYSKARNLTKKYLFQEEILELPLSFEQYLRVHLLERILLQDPNYLDPDKATEDKAANDTPKASYTMKSGDIAVQTFENESETEEKYRLNLEAQLDEVINHIGIGFTAYFFHPGLYKLDPDKVPYSYVALPIGNAVRGNYGRYIFSPTRDKSDVTFLLNYFKSIYQALRPCLNNGSC